MLNFHSTSDNYSTSLPSLCREEEPSHVGKDSYIESYKFLQTFNRDTAGLTSPQSQTSNLREPFIQTAATKESSYFPKIHVYAIEYSRNKLAFQQAKTKIISYSHLSSGWDGYGGVCPSKSSIIGAIDFLNEIETSGYDCPKTMLSGAGEIGFYWETEEIFIDVGIENDSEISYFAKSPSIGEVGEDDVPFIGRLPKELSAALKEYSRKR